MDSLDMRLERLVEAGIQPTDIWLEVVHTGASPRVSLQWDAYTLSLPANSGIGTRIICRSHAPGDWHTQPIASLHPVSIQTVMLEQQAAHMAEVTVALDDNTCWTALCVDYQWVYEQIHTRALYYWPGRYIPVRTLTSSCVLQVVTDLIERQVFEQAFTPIEETLPAAPTHYQLETGLAILHDPVCKTAIEQVLGPGIISDPHIWMTSLARPEIMPAQTDISNFLKMLAPHYQALSQMGIRRRDVHFFWTIPFSGQYILELPSGWLGELCRSGHGLELHFQRKADFVARCLA
ncbi:MAG: hypothetical protein SF053_06430 [Bacteroidia bacterium]|nr:hypothetical protein [Bacteroidia bacterium]